MHSATRMISERACQICSSSNAHRLSELNFMLFDDVNFSGEMNLVQCNECGFIYNDTSVTEEELTSYYNHQDYYQQSKGGGSGGISNADINRYERIGSVLSLNTITHEHYLLDVGCGKGGFLQWAAQNKYIIPVAVEASLACRNVIEKAGTFQVVKTLKNLPQKTMNTVVLSHVLEHMLHPKIFLTQIKQYLNSESILYCEVPNASEYLYPNYNWPVLYFEHINHFTKQSLCNLFQETGYKIQIAKETPFASGGPQKECIFIKTSLNKNASQKRLPCQRVSPEQFVTASNVIPYEDGRVCFWGLSQYAQLIFGSNKKLFDSVEVFFDNSPAKIGRTLKGKKVLPIKEMSKLTDHDILYIPSSPYVDEMQQYLRSLFFKGICIVL